MNRNPVEDVAEEATTILRSLAANGHITERQARVLCAIGGLDLNDVYAEWVVQKTPKAHGIPVEISIDTF